MGLVSFLQIWRVPPSPVEEGSRRSVPEGVCFGSCRRGRPRCPLGRCKRAGRRCSGISVQMWRGTRGARNRFQTRSPHPETLLENLSRATEQLIDGSVFPGTASPLPPRLHLNVTRALLLCGQLFRSLLSYVRSCLTRRFIRQE